MPVMMSTSKADQAFASAQLSGRVPVTQQSLSSAQAVIAAKPVWHTHAMYQQQDYSLHNAESVDATDIKQH